MSARLPRGCYSVGSAACKAGTRRSGRQSASADPGAASVVSGGQPHNTEHRGQVRQYFLTLTPYLSIGISKVNHVYVCFGMIQEFL